MAARLMLQGNVGAQDTIVLDVEDGRLAEWYKSYYFGHISLARKRGLQFKSRHSDHDKTRSNFPKAVTSKIPFKYPVHHLGFVRIYFQFSIRIDRVSVALALCHFGAAILKPFPETVLNCFTFLYHVHYNSPSINKNTAVKLLRRNEFTKFKYKKLTDYSPWCNLSTYHAISGPDEAKVVSWIFERYLAGDSLGKIAAGLERQGILSPTGKPKWNREAIDKLLSNEKYTGR